MVQGLTFSSGFSICVQPLVPKCGVSSADLQLCQSLPLHLSYVAPTHSKEPPVHGNVLSTPATTGVGLPGSRFSGRPACCQCSELLMLGFDFVGTISSSSHSLSAAAPCPCRWSLRLSGALVGAPSAVPLSRVYF